ncbi:hypothetical protein [Legionella sp.]|uniref:hypothetical protein n=1 Tax=Legionella sp. TaxID=459 RepID=UPI003C9306DE
MSAALSYCQKKYKKSWNNASNKKTIYDAFERLETEIKKLDEMIQVHLYSAMTQFLDSLIQEPDDPINPLEVFSLRCQSILGYDHESLNKIGLALGVIALSLAVLTTGAALGFGIGVALCLWQTPLMFMTCLLAAEVPAVAVAAASVSAGVGTGILSGWLFFKEPRVKTALSHCIETVKERHLSDKETEINQESSSELHQVIQ